MNIRYPIYEGVYRILTFYFNLVFLLSFFLEILKSCNHVLLKSCFQSFFPDWNISFNLAFNLEIRCKKREKKRPLKTLSRFVLRCPVLSTNHLFYSIINHRYFAAE